jgi:hypothetical protein
MLEEEALRRYGSDLARSVAENPDVVLAELEKGARQRAQNAIASIFLRADAVALAALLAGQPLADAEEAHAPFAQVVGDAERALAEARDSWKTQMMDLMKRHRPEDGVQTPRHPRARSGRRGSAGPCPQGRCPRR